MNIIIVEDEDKMARIIERGLKSEGYAVDVAATISRGLALISTSQCDLVILDLLLPDGSGTSLLRELRQQQKNLPVLILTARSELDVKAENFSAGADDYLVKPFPFAELLMRVKALLRRVPVPMIDTVQIADLELNRGARKVRRGGRYIGLSAKEFSLLEYFALNPGQVLSRSMIIDRVWGRSFEGLTNIVEVYIRSLRSKIDRDFEPKLIRTVRGCGYAMDPGREEL